MADLLPNKTPDEVFFEGLGGIKQEVTPPPASTQKQLTPISQPVTSKNLFYNVDTHPFVLDLALIKYFGINWFSWHNDVIFLEIERVHKTPVAEINKFKILAVQTLHVIDAYWDQWEIFEKTLLALNGHIPIMNHLQPLDLLTIMAGTDTANSIRKEKYGEEVARYTAACLLYEDVHYAPPPLDFCQAYLMQPKYKCNDCGLIASALPPWDGKCDSCTMKFDSDKNLNFKPDVKSDKIGTNVEIFSVYDPEPTQVVFEKLNREKPPLDSLEVPEVSYEIQGAKLYIAETYKKQLEERKLVQMKNLNNWLVAK